jgi:hypothetical protein
VIVLSGAFRAFGADHVRGSCPGCLACLSVLAARSGLACREERGPRSWVLDLLAKVGGVWLSPLLSRLGILERCRGFYGPRADGQRAKLMVIIFPSSQLPALGGREQEHEPVRQLFASETPIQPDAIGANRPAIPLHERNFAF